MLHRINSLQIAGEEIPGKKKKAICPKVYALTPLFPLPSVYPTLDFKNTESYPLANPWASLEQWFSTFLML